MSNEEFIKSITLEGEEWKDVVGFEGMYKVSSIGRIVSLERIVPMGDTVKIIPKRLLSVSLIPTSEYFLAKLWKENKQYNLYVHKIVAEAFLPNPNNYPCVDHIDTNKLNNNINNLKWCTYSQNSLNPITNAKLKASLKGNKKLIEYHSKPVVGINLLDKTDFRYYDSARSSRKDGFCESKVSAVCRKERKSHKGYVWYFKTEYDEIVNKSKSSLPEGSND